jgi:hypothetical protein
VGLEGQNDLRLPAGQIEKVVESAATGMIFFVQVAAQATDVASARFVEPAPPSGKAVTTATLGASIEPVSDRPQSYIRIGRTKAGANRHLTCVMDRTPSREALLVG